MKKYLLLYFCIYAAAFALLLILCFTVRVGEEEGSAEHFNSPADAAAVEIIPFPHEKSKAYSDFPLEIKKACIAGSLML